MFAEQLTTLNDAARWQDAWERLVPENPLLGPRWLLPWWRHYSDDLTGQRAPRELAIVGIFDTRSSLIAVAPWYIETTRLRGRVLRFLGVGEVCTDYLGIPCGTEQTLDVARTLADFLLTSRSIGEGPSLGRRPWDMLDFSAVSSECAVMRALAAELESRGALVRWSRGPTGWRLRLPDTWDAYLAILSKSHRKQVRRLTQRLLTSTRLTVHHVQTSAELPRGLEILRRLHRRRRLSRGEHDSFAGGRFATFHAEAAELLLARNQLRLTWVELDGEPIAAEYQVCGQRAVFAYQSGIDPAHLRAEPGRLATIATIKAAIERGDATFDFMRGDEPYKAHWRAEPRPTWSLRIWPGTRQDRVRQSIWQAGESVRTMMRDYRHALGL